MPAAMLLALLAALAVLALAGCSEDNPAEVGPREITVDAGGGGDYTTIQAALTAARDQDVVVIEPGTYSGPGNRNLTFGGSSPTVTGAEDRDLVVIDCGGAGRGFYMGGSSSPVIENLTVTGGDTVRGGGMYLEGSSPTLRNIRFISNYASYGGGGIYSRNGDPVLENVVFEENTSTVEGGGMLCLHSDAVLDGVAFERNQAVSGGGLACIFSDPALTRCVFWDNDTVFGVIYCGTSSPTITSCTVVGNNGSACSGVYCASGSSAEIRQTIVANGQAGEAIVCDGSTPYTTLSCFFGNGTLNEVCGTYTTSMLYEDPLFCDAYYGELTLAAGSPCLPDSNDWGVLIGAFGQGCDEPTRR